MANNNDILLDSDGDLLIKDGDFVIGFSTGQEIKDIIISGKGWWKGSPLTGVNMLAEINAPLTLPVKNGLQKTIKVQLEYDGMKVNKVDAVEWDDITVDAER